MYSTHALLGLGGGGGGVIHVCTCIYHQEFTPLSEFVNFELCWPIAVVLCVKSGRTAIGCEATVLLQASIV